MLRAFLLLLPPSPSLLSSHPWGTSLICSSSRTPKHGALLTLNLKYFEYFCGFHLLPMGLEGELRYPPACLVSTNSGD